MHTVLYLPIRLNQRVAIRTHTCRFSSRSFPLRYRRSHPIHLAVSKVASWHLRRQPHESFYCCSFTL